MRTCLVKKEAKTVKTEERRLAAIIYGEASTLENEDENYAIASVLVRQQLARGYKTIGDFMTAEPNYAYGAKTDRYADLMSATEEAIDQKRGMKIALAAARNALAGGADRSNGAYFWDGYDLKTNYSRHFKVAHGIKFSDPTHNVHGVLESTKVEIKYKHVVARDKRTGKVKRQTNEEVGRYDHIYESTAGYGGTVFWRHNPEYMKITGAKEYK